MNCFEPDMEKSAYCENLKKEMFEIFQGNKSWYKMYLDANGLQKAANDAGFPINRREAENFVMREGIDGKMNYLEFIRFMENQFSYGMNPRSQSCLEEYEKRLAAPWYRRK